MIKINNLRPLEYKLKSMTLKDLEPLYYSQIKKYSSPLGLLEDFLNSKRYAISRTNIFPITSNVQEDIVSYLITNFESVILGMPAKLEVMINHFALNAWSSEIYEAVNERLTQFGEALLDIFGYSERFRGVKSKGIWLAKMLNIKSCPYCNAQYTLYVNDSSSKELLKFQYDHFFPKSMFPYLSISLYNLIPSCANCNVKKSDKLLNLVDHYHPYHSELSKIAQFKLKYVPDPMLLTINSVHKQKYEVEFTPKFMDPHNIAEKHNKLFQINGVYSRHEDVFQELLIKAIIYNKSLIKSHLEIEKLFPNKELYLRYLIGNYPNQKDILNRPLAKFTQDIAKQLKLI